MSDGRERREQWATRYEQTQGEQFSWFMTSAPPQLLGLLDGPEPPPSGRAIDLGCGPGTVTAELSARFGFVVGLDYVFPAVAQARRRLESDGRAASFVVADASTPPFRPGSFTFVFDRGCLQNIPRDRWLTYFEQTERILAPRGVLQLLCSRTTGRASVFSGAGLKTRLRSMLGKPAEPPGPQWLSHDLLRRLAPATLQVDLMEDFPFVTQRGNKRTFTHGLFRKTTSDRG
ncbi:MAG: class I SAM-dependent methyltransferase [Acidimicrobiales bacterium]